MTISLSQLQAKRKQLADKITLPRLFYVLKKAHAKRYYKTCNCDYCILKRGVILNINGGYYSFSRERRDLAINRYRAKLADLMI